MDKGTQEKVKTKRPWSWEGEFICKTCKKMHPFAEYDREEFVFPNGDVSVVNIPCLEHGLYSHKYEQYKYEELIMPPATRIETKLDETEQRVSRLETMLGQGDLSQNEKPVRDRLTSLEGILTELAQGKPKEPRPELSQ
jgi:hypothetical protein